MKKALHMIETAESGGAEAVLVRLAVGTSQQLQPMGLTMAEGWTSAELRKHSIPCIVKPLRRAFDMSWVRDVARLLREERIDILVCHEFSACVYGMMSARLAGVPCVLVMHGRKYWPEARYRRIAMRVAIALADRVVSVSDDLRSFMCMATGAAPSRIGVIYNGIPVAQFAPTGGREPARAAFGVGAAQRVVVSVGALTAIKGHIHLLEAAQRLRDPNLRVFIVGDGALREELQRYIEEHDLGSSVTLAGQQSDIRPYLSMADIFCLPSLSEALPLAVLEAMAVRLPVVASHVGEIPVLVKDSAGLLVPPGNSEALAAALARLAADPALRSAMGAAGHRRVTDDFQESTMLERYLELFASVLRK